MSWSINNISILILMMSKTYATMAMELLPIITLKTGNTYYANQDGVTNAMVSMLNQSVVCYIRTL